jgi:hypothetical protein
MVEFADTTGLKVRLVYYTPYHSKYNYIEPAVLILAFLEKRHHRLARNNGKHQRLISGKETTDCKAAAMSFSSKPGGIR